jgi:uncharacterized spore protein YtfJ
MGLRSFGRIGMMRSKEAEQKGRLLGSNSRQSICRGSIVQNARFGVGHWRGAKKVPVAVLVVAAATMICLHLDWFSAGQVFSSIVMPAS